MAALNPLPSNTTLVTMDVTSEEDLNLPGLGLSGIKYLKGFSSMYQ
jgi:hypothetical protein